MALVWLTMNPATAQTAKNNLHFSVGLVQRVVVEGGNAFSSDDDRTVTASPFQNFGDITYTGPITLGYRRQVHRLVTVGASLTGGYYKDDFTGGSLPGIGNRLWYVGVAAEGTCRYWQRGRMEVYCLAGLGLDFQHLETQAVNFNQNQVSKSTILYQLTPLGVSFGGRMKGFMEAGLGYKGYVCVGIQRAW
jgi:hypothetical protein